MYKYPHISCGYIGKKNPNATITSAFFAKYWQHPELVNQEIIFPQRIPKIGYFQELCDLENKIFSSDLKRINNNIKRYVAESLTDNRAAGINSFAIINIIKVMLRYSLFEDVISIAIPRYISPAIAIEINFLQSVARLEIHLSREMGQLSLDELIHLITKMSEIKNITQKFELNLLNRIVVYFYRHRAQTNNGVIMGLLERYISQLINFSEMDFNSSILRSMCYRGVAMANELGLSKQEEFLNLAEYYARTIKYDHEIERLVVIDNLCTCLLSVAKWNIQVENYTKAEALFSEICELDPFDSVGYCEMGVLLHRVNRFSDAAYYFKKAALLGPPGVGMNTYFQAKCLEQISPQEKFVSVLHQAAEIDKNAISPLLDLFHYYKDQCPSNSKNIAKKILSSPILKKQLTQHEINNLESVN